MLQKNWIVWNIAWTEDSCTIRSLSFECFESKFIDHFMLELDHASLTVSLLFSACNIAMNCFKYFVADTLSISIHCIAHPSTLSLSAIRVHQIISLRIMPIGRPFSRCPCPIIRPCSSPIAITSHPRKRNSFESLEGYLADLASFFRAFFWAEAALPSRRRFRLAVRLSWQLVELPWRSS